MKNIFIILFGLILLTGCKSNNKNAINLNRPEISEIFLIDTLLIHDNTHEIIRLEGNYGIMHSPECWCLKNSKK